MSKIPFHYHYNINRWLFHCINWKRWMLQKAKRILLKSIFRSYLLIIMSSGSWDLLTTTMLYRTFKPLFNRIIKSNKHSHPYILYNIIYVFYWPDISEIVFFYCIFIWWWWWCTWHLGLVLPFWMFVWNVLFWIIIEWDSSIFNVYRFNFY